MINDTLRGKKTLLTKILSIFPKFIFLQSSEKTPKKPLKEKLFSKTRKGR